MQPSVSLQWSHDQMLGMLVLNLALQLDIFDLLDGDSPSEESKITRGFAWSECLLGLDIFLSKVVLLYLEGNFCDVRPTS